jgi:malate/lactate dehydrogenase
VPVEDIKNIYIWGNHSATQYPDTHHASIGGKPLRQVVNDNAYLEGAFLEKVQKRGAEIISVMGKSSAASAANAACDHVHDWWYGTKPGCHVSMAVTSDGNTYGVPEGLVYSFPCECANGEWKVVNGIANNDFSKDKMKKTATELLEERKMALGK